MKTLESHLQYHLLDLKGHAEEYKDMKHEDKEIEHMFKGKSQAYTHAARQLDDIIKWHSRPEVTEEDARKLAVDFYGDNLNSLAGQLQREGYVKGYMDALKSMKKI